MNNKKINALLALAITTSVITSASLNNTIASAATKGLSINTESSSKGYGIASFVYEQLLEKGWKKSSNDTLTMNGNMFKFRNLKGVNGKDASVVIKCADEAYDHYILELLDLMVSKGSTITSKELAFMIANGSGTIEDGSRLINVHYDGKVDYTITLTFYNYGYNPEYILPSLDNYEMISTFENLINKKILSLINIWGGTEKRPLEMEVNSTDNSDIDELFNNLNSISDNVNSAKIIENDDYSILQINFNKENSLYNGTYFDYITVNLKMDNTNSYAIESAKKLINEFNKVSTDDESQTGDDSSNSNDNNNNNNVPPVSNGDESGTESVEDTETITNVYGIASSVYEKLLEKGWNKTSDTTLSLNRNMFKFRNLKGVNGKDASVVIKCAETEYDHHILELLDLMIGKDSSLTSEELALLIANGSATIKDGSRLINVHYDGKVDYTITLTFYNYGYNPEYILPSLDNYEIISTFENLINKKILSLTNIWGGTEEHPLEMEIKSFSTLDIDGLFSNLNSISSNVNSAKILENDDYSILQINFNKENSLYNGTYFDYITVNLKIDKTNSYAIESAKKLVNEFNKVSTDDDSQNGDQPDNSTPAVPPVVDNGNGESSDKPGTEVGNETGDSTDSELGDGTTSDDEVSSDDETSTDGSQNDGQSDNTTPVVPPVVDNGNGESGDKPDNEVGDETGDSSDSGLGNDTNSDNEDSDNDTPLPPTNEDGSETGDNTIVGDGPQTDDEVDGSQDDDVISGDNNTSNDDSENDDQSNNTTPVVPPVVDNSGESGDRPDNEVGDETGDSSDSELDDDTDSDDGASSDDSQDGTTSDDEVSSEDTSVPPTSEDESKDDNTLVGNGSQSDDETGAEDGSQGDDVISGDDNTSNDDSQTSDDSLVEIDTVINAAVSEGVISIKDNSDQSFDLVEMDINNVEIAKVQSLFDSFATIANDVKITSNGEYTTITFKVKKSSNPFLRLADEYTEIVITIKNEYTDIVAIATDFAKDMSTTDEDEDTDIKDNNTNDTDEESENISNSNDSKPNNTGQESDKNNNSQSNDTNIVIDKNNISESTTNNKNTVKVNSTSVNTNTEATNSNEIKSLPKTGGVSSLPFLGMLSLSLGGILKRKKK